MEAHQSLRFLNPTVAFVKLRKLVQAGIEISDICPRLNYSNSDEIKELVNILHDRDLFVSKVNEINRKIRVERVRRNFEGVLADIERHKTSEPVQLDVLGSSVNWSSLPKHVIPDMMSFGTYLAGKRKDWAGLARRILHCRRKRMQIESMLVLIRKYKQLEQESQLRILDLCGGRGDLGVFLAYHFQESELTIMDKNKLALEQASYRANMLGLTNLRTKEVDLFEYRPAAGERWDVVIGLHACGSLTDMIISNFRNNCDHLFVATCCFGKMTPQHKFSKYADSDTGGRNSSTSRLAKLVINTARGAHIPGFQIIEVNESCFSSKNQILYFPPSPEY
jgi:hypothetical protein